MIQLGNTVRDQVTGFEGVVTARLEVLKGVPRFRVEGTALHEGKVVEEWFEEGRIEIAQSQTASERASEAA